MYKVHDILIPLRFCILMLQTVFSIVVFFTKSDNVYSTISPSVDSSSAQYQSAEFTVTVGCILFYVFEGVEIVVIFSGITLFLNKLSLNQIFFHFVGTILLAWFIFQKWAASQIWAAWILGSLIPIIFEIGGLMMVWLHYRKVLKLN